MTAEPRDARAWLDAWRANGADRVDPVRFRMLDAFAQRASTHRGEARRVLDARVAALLAAYAADVERANTPRDDAATSRAARPQPHPLRALNDHLARQDLPHRASWPELDALDDFRTTWSRISADVQFRQSRDQVPTNAGPLNSSSLVHRALSLMREQSPAYLRHFLSYVDALAWLDQMSTGDASAQKEVRRAAGAKKTERKSAKTRPR